MWTAILSSVLKLGEKVLDIAIIKLLTKHVERIAELEKQLNAEYVKALDSQDDLLIPYLESLLEVELSAFNRQLEVGVKAMSPS